MRKFLFNFKFSVLLVGIIGSMIVLSCEQDDVFTGSPVDSDVSFVTLRGEVTTEETQLVPGQSFPITISLGDNLDTPEVDVLTFPVDVNVEVIAFIKGQDRRSRLSFVIPAGENSIEATMIAPTLGIGGQTSVNYFDLDLQLYLSAIVTGSDVKPRGFQGKQYSLVSDTLNLGFGTTNFNEVADSQRCHIRFDWEGPWTGSSSNNLDIVFKKNGTAFRVSGPNDTRRPVYGTTAATGRYETINFVDRSQGYEIMNLTREDSINGVYTIKSPNTPSNNRPHGFRVGDEIKLETIKDNSSNQITAVITSVADDYTCTFTRTGGHLFQGIGTSFHQPIIVPRLTSSGAAEAWSPFLAYSGNQSVVVNGTTYYCRRDISASVTGSNTTPVLDAANWTSTKPKLIWLNEFANPQAWESGESYSVNDVRVLNNIFYVCIKQHNSTSTNGPANSAINWTTAAVELETNVLHYTASDTFTIEAFARRLVGSPADLKYRFAVLLPSGIGKAYIGQFSGLTVQPASNAVLKLTIQRTITEGASTYVITHSD